MNPKVTVIGSSNIDLVVKTNRIPAIGETILGTDFFMVPGGKGANQAVAAAKLGAQVSFIAKLGKDLYAQKSLANFDKVGVKREFIYQTEEAPSGIASIIVDEHGHNSIVVVAGANGLLSPADIESAQQAFESTGIVVSQLEIPMETVLKAAQMANEAGIRFILDPAPARELPNELFKYIWLIKPNETEAKILTGIDVQDGESANEAAKILIAKGVKNVIVTLGQKGYIIADQTGYRFYDSIRVDAVDTTAAGDAFTGGLAFCLANGDSLEDACRFANKVAAVSVTRSGAQPSLPTYEEVQAFPRK